MPRSFPAKKNPQTDRDQLGDLPSLQESYIGFGRSSDSWIFLLPAPSHTVSSLMAYGIVVSFGFRPHIQRRVRAGFAPASLFWPDTGHRTPATYSITPPYSIHGTLLSISLITIFKLRFLSNKLLLTFSIIPSRNLQKNTHVAGDINIRKLNISCQNPLRLSSWKSGRYDLRMITFQRFRNATFIADTHTPGVTQRGLKILL